MVADRLNICAGKLRKWADLVETKDNNTSAI